MATMLQQPMGHMLQGNAMTNIISGGSSTKNATLDGVIKNLADIVAYNEGARTQRKAEVGNVREQRQDYSKEAAFADAQALMAQQMEDALTQSMGGINRAAAGAGASASSMRALLAQEAARKAAQDSAALGAQQATSYGGINSNLSGILEALTRSESVDPLIDALRLRFQQNAAQRATTSSSPKRVWNNSQQDGGKGQVSVGVPKTITAAVAPTVQAGGSSSSTRPTVLGNSAGSGLTYYGPTVSSDELIDYYSRLITNQGVNSQEAYRDYIYGNINQLIP